MSKYREKKADDSHGSLIAPNALIMIHLHRYQAVGTPIISQHLYL